MRKAPSRTRAGKHEPMLCTHSAPRRGRHQRLSREPEPRKGKCCSAASRGARTDLRHGCSSPGLELDLRTNNRQPARQVASQTRRPYTPRAAQRSFLLDSRRSYGKALWRPRRAEGSGFNPPPAPPKDLSLFVQYHPVPVPEVALPRLLQQPIAYTHTHILLYIFSLRGHFTGLTPIATD